MARAFVAASSQYLSSGSPPATATPLTIFAWIRPTSHPASGVERAIAGVYNTGAARSLFEIVQRGDGTGSFVRARQHGSSGNAQAANTANGTITSGAWNFVAGVFRANNDRSAYAGTARGDNTASIAAPAGINNVTIGRKSMSTPADYFDGAIAVVGIVTAALTDRELRALANATNPLTVRPGSLVLWPLYGIGANEPAICGRATLTVTGATRARHAPVSPLWAPMDAGEIVIPSAGGTLYMASVGGTLSSAGGLAKQAAHAVAGTASTSGALARAVQHSTSGALGSAAELSRLVQRDLTGTAATSGVLGRALQHSLAGTLGSAAVLARAVARALSGTLGSGATLERQVHHATGGTETPVGALDYPTTLQVVLAGTLSSAATLAREGRRNVGNGTENTDATLSHVVYRDLGVSTEAPVGAVSREARRTLTGTVALDGALVRAVQRALAGTVGTTGTLGTTQLLEVLLDATMATSGALTRKVFHVVQGTVGPSSTLTRHLLRGVSGSLGPVGGVAKLLQRALHALLVAVGLVERASDANILGKVTGGVVALGEAEGGAVLDGRLHGGSLTRVELASGAVLAGDVE